MFNTSKLLTSITKELIINNLVVNNNYYVKQFILFNEEEYINDYGIGIYLGTYLNQGNLELLFYFDNEKIENVNFASSYMIDVGHQEYISVYRFYTIADLIISEI